MFQLQELASCALASAIYPFVEIISIKSVSQWTIFS